MRLSITIMMGAAVLAASVAVASVGTSASANASELHAPRAQAAANVSARRKSARHHRGTSVRVSKLSRRATAPPNPYRPYYRPVPRFYPFGQDRGFF